LVLESFEEPSLLGFRKAGTLKYVPAKNRLTIDLIHILAPGSGASDIGEFDFGFRNLNFE
jgi:hypothetical protein